MIEKTTLQKLKVKAEIAPHKPGVYLFKDAQEQVIYIGKAKDLRKRLGSYFLKNHPAKSEQIVNKANDLEVLVVSSEMEALILESNLMKRFKPRYNVKLKDDKSFLYIRIPVQEDFPAITLVRKIIDRESKYFGPFTNSKELRISLKRLHKVFPYRTCSLKVAEGVKNRACLDFYLGYCLGPCLGNVAKKEYHQVIANLILFLKGRQAEVIKTLENQMIGLAAEKKFERAAKIRDEIQGLKRIIARQKVVSVKPVNQDLIGLAQSKDEAVVNLFLVREGRLVDSEYFILKDVFQMPAEEILTSFLSNYYQRVFDFPDEIVLKTKPIQLDILQEWLRKVAKKKVVFTIAQRGQKSNLLKLASENATLHLQSLKQLKKNRRYFTIEKSLQELMKVIQYQRLAPQFNFKQLKRFRIEGYDISNLQGREAYGSMVVLEIFEKQIENKEEGKRESRWLTRLAKDQYRIFRVRTVKGSNDYKMFKEVLLRRFGNRRKHQDDSSFATLPELILIDGGKGQLNMALKVLKDLCLNIPTISLAKKKEIIFTPLRSRGIRLKPDSAALKLLQRLRDESHRFSLKFHHGLRSRKIKGEIE